MVSLPARHFTENQRDMKTDEDWAVSLPPAAPSTQTGAGGGSAGRQTAG